MFFQRGTEGRNEGRGEKRKETGRRRGRREMKEREVVFWYYASKVKWGVIGL